MRQRTAPHRMRTAHTTLTFGLNSTALELNERAFALGSKRGFGSNDLSNPYRGSVRGDRERKQ